MPLRLISKGWQSYAKLSLGREPEPALYYLNEVARILVSPADRQCLYLPPRVVQPLAGMNLTCYHHDMANLQVKNIPDELHERLRRHAREHNCTISAVVLTAVERELSRSEWSERLAQRTLTVLGIPAADLLQAERAQHEREIE